MGPPPRFIKRLIYDLQNRSDKELPELLRNTKKHHDFDIYLLKTDGLDLYGRTLPSGAEQIADQLQLQGRRRAFLRLPDKTLLGHSIYRPEQGLLDVVIVFKPMRKTFISALGTNIWLRLGLAVLVSGLVCFVLSRAMTNRFKQLKQASRRLAQGDLSTRMSVREHGDETDELARDINSMAKQIEHQITSQKRLLGDVSHELRSPLARLRIALALAQEDSANGPKHLQRIDHEAERLEELIAQLLDSQATEADLDAHIDLAALLQELCADANFEGKPTNRHVDFTSALEEAIVSTHGDLLKKTFENILRNALKYTPDNSTVQVSLALIGEDYSIRVEDAGPGVEEAELDKLFGEFYRVDTARPRETGGYGLGLSIAKRAIDQHRGLITAANTSRGFAITVHLPAYSE